MAEQQVPETVAVACVECENEVILTKDQYITALLGKAEAYQCAECKGRAERGTTLRMKLAQVARAVGFRFGV